MNTRGLSVGLVVESPNAPQWGPGKILAIDEQTVTVRFRGDPGKGSDGVVKKINLNYGTLAPSSQSDPFPKTSSGSKQKKPKITKPPFTMAGSISTFLGIFPLGFKDPEYIGVQQSGERQYKWDAHLQWNKTLSGAAGKHLLAANNIEEMVRRAQSVEARVNLLSIFEKAALRDGLKDKAAAQVFFETLFDLLASPEPSEERFNSYLSAVECLPVRKDGHPVARWPATTILPFLARPDCFMFLKPEATKECAELLGFELNYRTDPNWFTYKKLLEMCEILREHLKPLKPRDMIDLQSFIWVVWKFRGGDYEI